MESRESQSPHTVVYSPIGDNDSNLKQVRLELLTKINEVAKEVHDVREKNNERISKVKEFLEYHKTQIGELKKCCDTKGSSSAKRVPQRVSGLFNSIPHNLFDTGPQPQVSSSAATSHRHTPDEWEEITNSKEWAEIIKGEEEEKQKRDEQVNKLRRKAAETRNNKKKERENQKGGKNKKKQTRKRRKTKRRVTKH